MWDDGLWSLMGGLWLFVDRIEGFEGTLIAILVGMTRWTLLRRSNHSLYQASGSQSDIPCVLPDTVLRITSQSQSYIDYRLRRVESAVTAFVQFWQRPAVSSRNGLDQLPKSRSDCARLWCPADVLLLSDDACAAFEKPRCWTTNGCSILRIGWFSAKLSDSFGSPSIPIRRTRKGAYWMFFALRLNALTQQQSIVSRASTTASLRNVCICNYEGYYLNKNALLALSIYALNKRFDNYASLFILILPPRQSDPKLVALELIF